MAPRSVPVRVVSGGPGFPKVYDLSRGQSRESIPRGAVYYGPDGAIRRNDNGDRGNPILKGPPPPSAAAARAQAAAANLAAKYRTARFIEDFHPAPPQARPSQGAPRLPSRDDIERALAGFNLQSRLMSAGERAAMVKAGTTGKDLDAVLDQLAKRQAQDAAAGGWSVAASGVGPQIQAYLAKRQGRDKPPR